jgi:hypothetical protein
VKKQILIVSSCPQRGGAIGVIGELLKELSCLDKNSYSFSLFDTNYNSNEHHNEKDYNVDNYYNFYNNFIDDLIRHIPWIRSRYYKRKYIKAFKKILSEKVYNTILFFPVIYFADTLIDIAHSRKAKVIFYPWGSEILRCKQWKMNSLLRAFSKVDYVVGAKNANTIMAAKDTFGVPKTRIREKKPFVSNIATMDEVKGKFSRAEMSKRLGIPEADYNIVCSYNGYATHRHDVIIDAIFKNKSYLPNNYQLLFPLTYGAEVGYIQRLKEQCNTKGLKAFFLTNYLSVEQMACLHYLTDLFIEIQPTDTGNGFLIEALYARNLIITGSWLHYEQFEKYGIPYHLIDTTDELPQKITDILSMKLSRPVVPNEIINMYSVPSAADRRLFWTEVLG